MAGMISAIALKALNLSILVIEKSASESDERSTALNYATKIFFDQYKIWPLLENEAQPILDIFTVEGKSTNYLHYDHRMNNSKPMGYVIKNKIIKAALDSFKVNKLSPITYDKINCYDDKVELYLTNGKKITADLFICAEGKFSEIYNILNIKCIKKEYNQTSIVCNVEHLEDHSGTAQERFYSTGPFALLPMKGAFYSSLIWTAESNFAKKLLQLSQKDFLQTINKYCNFHITKIVSKVHSYPISVQIARRYYKDRVLLIGDTMQSIHPVAGQGFNLAVHNIESFVKHIKKYGINSTALKNFSYDRIIDNLLMTGTTHSIVKLFSNENKLLKLVRNTGLAVIQELPFIKQKLIHYATGISKSWNS